MKAVIGWVGAFLVLLTVQLMTGPHNFGVVLSYWAIHAVVGLGIGKSIEVWRKERGFKLACTQVYLSEGDVGWCAWPRRDGMDRYESAERVYGDSPEEAIRLWRDIHGRR